MQYGDESIISQRLTEQAAQAYTINNEIKILGIVYTFTERAFEYGFSMVVPERFDTLSPVYAKRKFPYEDRPGIIIANDDGTTCLAFNRGDTAADESLEERMHKYRACIKRLHPSNVFFTERVYSLSNNLEVACYDYRYSVIDGDIYNFSFFTDLQDNELFGWFTCPVELQDKWEPLVREMIQTIKVIKV